MKEVKDANHPVLLYINKDGLEQGYTFTQPGTTTFQGKTLGGMVIKITVEASND